MTDEARAAIADHPHSMQLRVRAGLRRPHNWLQLIKFCGVGASGYVVNLCVFTICVEVLDLFFAFLGTVAGNLALSLGTRGGMFIGGGIVPRLGDAIDRSRFRRCFESKGRLSPYVQAIPTFVVQAKTSPALMGAARALEEL